MSERTRAERRMDELAAEKRRLLAVSNPSARQRARLFEIDTEKLPAAWRAVQQVRERER